MSIVGLAPPPPTVGVILAGGLSRRMGGGDKSLLTIGERTLVQCVAERLAVQCARLILNVNGDPARFDDMNLPIVPDTLADHPGPLAGILAALEWAAVHAPSVEWVVSVPGDTPFIPGDLVERLHEDRRASGLPLVCASSASRRHFAVGLWPVSLRHDLRSAMVGRGTRSIREWAGPHGLAEASWPEDPVDPFFNVNTPDELDRARALAQRKDFP